MRKRERENPCEICGHYHKYEEGEVCRDCGHRMPAAVSDLSPSTSVHVSAFPSEILPEFLYLGSYDNAARSELLKTLGISHILSAVSACLTLYRNTFTYHCLQEDEKMPFDDAIQFLEQCEKDRVRVLVHCMSGRNRSPAIVMAYLMKSRSWKLAQSYQWVKDRRPSVDLNQDVYQQLQEYEQKIFGSVENSSITMPIFPSSSSPSFSFGFSTPNNDSQNYVPSFNSIGGTSVFSRASFDIPPQGFAFGASANVPSVEDFVTGLVSQD